MDVLGDKHHIGTLLQKRDDFLIKHRAHLSRRPGQEDCHLAVLLHGKSRCGTVIVWEHNGSFWHKRLLFVVVRHLSSETPKMGGNPLKRFLVQLHIPVEIFCHHLLGQVVVGRAKAAS